MCPESANPYKDYYTLMRELKDPKLLRLHMVRCARESGVKDAARLFKTTPKTVRKWLARYDGTLASLQDRSRAPKTHPNALSPKHEARIVQAKRSLPTWGARRLKRDFAIPHSVKTISRVIKKHGLARRWRRKKHETKRCLREIKKHWQLLQQVDVDTKYLLDIPEYARQHMIRPELPTCQYTWRDVSTGLLYLAFADELSLSYSTLFADLIIKHLLLCGLDLSNSTWQTDNGAEFVGSWQAIDDSRFTKIVQAVPGQIHRTIPPGQHRWQADVETVHSLIESELLQIESFRDRRDFIRKANSYQLFFNLARPNSGKEYKTPWQLIQQKLPSPDPRIPLLPVVFLPQLLLHPFSDPLPKPLTFPSPLLQSPLNKNPPGGYDVGGLP